MNEMSHNNLGIYIQRYQMSFEHHYQLLECMFVLCINKQNNAVVVIPLTVQI